MTIFPSRDEARALTKPTIVAGEWVNLPPPHQDAEWLKRHGYPVTDLKDANNGNLR